MSDFWTFARQMLHFRRLLIIGGAAALVDAMCAFSGTAILLVLIDQLFGEDAKTARQFVEDKLSHPRITAWFGDLTPWADVVPKEEFAGLVFAMGVVIALVLLGATVRIIYQMCAFTIGLSTVMRIRKAAFHHLIHAPYELLMAENSADILSRVSRDSVGLNAGFNSLLGKAVREVLMVTVFLSLAVIANWKLSLLFLGGAPLIAVFVRLFGRKVRKASRKAMHAYGSMLGALQESVQAIAVVKVHNAEGYERRRFNTINRRVLRQELKARAARSVSAPLMDLFGVIGVCVVAAVAGWMIYMPGSTTQAPDLLKVMLLLGMASRSVKPLANLNNTLNESAAVATRIAEVLNLPVEANTRGTGSGAAAAAPLPVHDTAIRFEDVAYAYPGADRDALDGVDLEVGFGKTVAVVGPNGSGKSTLLNLLPRLLDPHRGRVLIDGVDISSVSLRSLRRQIAVVTQQSVLFEGTIADNIAYGRRHTRQDEIEAAARTAYAHEFIEPLPHGYATPLGEMGSGLSGGQRQRLCIARAVLRDPAILILDEATSQVDADSEAKINEAMRVLRRGRTTFVIAHRLSTVIDADLIVVMDEGRIVDRGTHGELIERCELYATLARTQLGDYRAA